MRSGHRQQQQPSSFSGYSPSRPSHHASPPFQQYNNSSNNNYPNGTTNGRGGGGLPWADGGDDDGNFTLEDFMNLEPAGTWSEPTSQRNSLGPERGGDFTPYPPSSRSGNDVQAVMTSPGSNGGRASGGGGANAYPNPANRNRYDERQGPRPALPSAAVPFSDGFLEKIGRGSLVRPHGPRGSTGGGGGGGLSAPAPAMGYAAHDASIHRSGPTPRNSSTTRDNEAVHTGDHHPNNQRDGEGPVRGVVSYAAYVEQYQRASGMRREEGEIEGRRSAGHGGRYVPRRYPTTATTTGSSSTRGGHASHDEDRDPVMDSPLATVECFYRACLRVERDIDADERYLQTMCNVESELRTLLGWSRGLCQSIVSHAPRGEAGGSRRSGGGGGRKMEADLRLLGEVLKRLEMSEKVLAPLERTHLLLLKKYILLSGSGRDAAAALEENRDSNAEAACPMVPEEAFESFARAYFALTGAPQHTVTANRTHRDEPADENGRDSDGSTNSNNNNTSSTSFSATNVIDEILSATSPSFDAEARNQGGPYQRTHGTRATSTTAAAVGRDGVRDGYDNAETLAHLPPSELGEVSLMRGKLESFLERREAIRRRLLDELLFRNKNEGGGSHAWGSNTPYSHENATAHGDRNATRGGRPLPSEAIAREQQCIVSGRASDVDSVVQYHQQQQQPPPHEPEEETAAGPSTFSQEEEPILIVNIENDAAANHNTTEYSAHCSPAFLSQLRQFEEFQRVSYHLPAAPIRGSGEEDPSATTKTTAAPSHLEGKAASDTASNVPVFTVITTPARFACFHVVESARAVLTDLQRRVDTLVKQREERLASLQRDVASMDPYDPMLNHADEERARMAKDVQTFVSWQVMMRKLAGRVVVPLRERIVTAILQHAMVRKSLLEVLAQRIEDTESTVAPTHGGSAGAATTDTSAHDPQNAALGGGGHVKEEKGTTAVPDAATIATSVVMRRRRQQQQQHHHHRDQTGGDAMLDEEAEDHFSNRSSTGGGTVGAANGPLPRASAAFIAMLEDIAREQDNLLHHGVHSSGNSGSVKPSHLHAAGASETAGRASGGAVRKRVRDADGEEGEEDAVAAQALEPFLEMDAVSATTAPTVSQDTSTGEPLVVPQQATQPPADEEETGEATERKTEEEPPVLAATAAAGEGQVPLEVVEEAITASKKRGPGRPRKAKKGARKNTKKKPQKRVYGLRTLVVDQGAEAKHDGDENSRGSQGSQTSDESGGGGSGGLWRGIGAFLRAVVHRATRFSESDTSSSSPSSSSSSARASSTGSSLTHESDGDAGDQPSPEKRRRL